MVVFDSFIVGLGGCLYVWGVLGNVVIEDVVYLMYGLGIEMGIDLVKLVVIGEWIFSVFNCLNGVKVGWVFCVKVIM